MDIYELLRTIDKIEDLSILEEVDFYLYLPTMRYIYETPFKKWRGTKNPAPAILLPEKEREKIKTFANEDEAVRWLSGKRINKK